MIPDRGACMLHHLIAIFFLIMIHGKQQTLHAWSGLLFDIDFIVVKFGTMRDSCHQHRMCRLSKQWLTWGHQLRSWLCESAIIDNRKAICGEMREAKIVKSRIWVVHASRSKSDNAIQAKSIWKADVVDLHCCIFYAHLVRMHRARSFFNDSDVVCVKMLLLGFEFCNICGFHGAWLVDDAALIVGLACATSKHTIRARFEFGTTKALSANTAFCAVHFLVELQKQTVILSKNFGF